jgi:hypothetical protein
MLDRPIHARYGRVSMPKASLIFKLGVYRVTICRPQAFKKAPIA